MPNRILLVLLFSTALTASACISEPRTAPPEYMPVRSLHDVPAVPPPPEQEKVSILTKQVVVAEQIPAVAAEVVTEEKQDINAELIDGVIVITPERAIKESRKEEKDYRVIRVKCSGYCPCEKCCGRDAIGLTRTETNAWKPGIAVDPRVIPLGSVINVPGYNRAEWSIADDTGGKIKGNRIDIRFQYHWEAREWGIKYLDIKIRKARR